MKRHARRLPVFGMTMAEEGTRDRRRSQPAGLLTLGIGVAMCCALATGTALAGGGVAADDPGKRRFCSATTLAQFKACGKEVEDDFFVAKAKCINVSDEKKRKECFVEAKAQRREGRQLCGQQRVARKDLCAALGEDRYDPDFDPALFDDDFRNLTNPNPYFPLTIGNVWTYQTEGESNTIVVLDKTKLIEGVTCIVVNDRVEKEGGGEDTDDWYAQRKDGTVDYCGENVRDFETFEGDDPEEPELVAIDGSFKAGRDGDLPGMIFLGSPTVGTTYRQEFSPGNAEDAATVLSTTYGFGSDPELDEFVPQVLAERLCNDDCVVTGEVVPLEPGVFQRKYYASGIGLFLEVDPGTGDINRLVECNFDPRCVDLPTP